MRNARRYKLGIGLTLALAATALGGTNALAFPAPVDTTTASDATSILPPPPGGPRRSHPYPVNRTVILRSPETGRNVRVPAFDSLQAEQFEYAISILRSPETGRNVRVPAF